jgi:hypothetical protein
MDLLIDYCWNDVNFTWDLAHDCWNAVKFRENMSKVFNKNVMDYSNVKIGEFLNQKKYEELSGRKYSDFKDERTHREGYSMKDIIPECVGFYTPFMQGFLENLNKKTFK